MNVPACVWRFAAAFGMTSLGEVDYDAKLQSVCVFQRRAHVVQARLCDEEMKEIVVCRIYKPGNNILCCPVLRIDMAEPDACWLRMRRLLGHSNEDGEWFSVGFWNLELARFRQEADGLYTAHQRLELKLEFEERKMALEEQYLDFMLERFKKYRLRKMRVEMEALRLIEKEGSKK